MHHSSSSNRALRTAVMASLAVTLAAVAPLGAGARPAMASHRPTNGPIAYMRFVGDEPHVSVVEPDGSGTHDLELAQPGFLPSWSSDGRQLLLTTFTPDTLRPMLVDIVHGTTTILDVPGAPVDLAIICRAWSPNDRRLLCQGDSISAAHPESNGIYSIRIDGTGLTRLTRDAFPPVFGDEGMCGGGDQPGGYSPDGSRFVFTRTRCGSLPAPDADQTAALFVADASDGGHRRQITPYGLPWSHEEGLARWSPDGHRILFASADGELLTIRPDGSSRTKIRLDVPKKSQPFAIAPDWAPDGQRIVFSLFLDGPSGIYNADASGRDLVLLAAQGPDFVNEPDWGPAIR